MDNARKEQQQKIEREKQKKHFYEDQRKQINQYKQLKARTDQLLSLPGLATNNMYGGGNSGVSMFYERQNFGFPITTTTSDGGIVTQYSGANQQQIKGIDGLTRLNADIKTGQVQLEEFQDGRKNDEARNRGEDSLDMVGQSLP